MASNIYQQRPRLYPTNSPTTDTSKDEELAKRLQADEDRKIRMSRSGSFTATLPKSPSSNQMRSRLGTRSPVNDDLNRALITSNNSQNDSDSHDDSVVILDSNGNSPVAPRRARHTLFNPPTLRKSTRQDTSKDEEIARKMQEELDKELANSIMQNSIDHVHHCHHHHIRRPIRPGPLNHDADEPMDIDRLDGLGESVSHLRNVNAHGHHGLPPVASNASRLLTNSTARTIPNVRSTVYAISRTSSSSSSNLSSAGGTSSRSPAPSLREIPHSMQNDMLTEIARSNSAANLNPSAVRTHVSFADSGRPNLHSASSGLNTEHALTRGLSFLQDSTEFDRLMNRYSSNRDRSRGNTSTSYSASRDTSSHRPAVPLNVQRADEFMRRHPDHPYTHRPTIPLDEQRADLFMRRHHHVVDMSSRYGRSIPNFFSNRDFTSGDYESLLRLDEMNGVVKKLSSAEIQSLPTFEFKSTHAASDDKTCSICFEDYQLKETLIALACSHKFHKGCIVQWLKANRSCPLCKKDAVTGRN